MAMDNSYREKMLRTHAKKVEQFGPWKIVQFKIICYWAWDCTLGVCNNYTYSHTTTHEFGNARLSLSFSHTFSSSSRFLSLTYYPISLSFSFSIDLVYLHAYYKNETVKIISFLNRCKHIICWRLIWYVLFFHYLIVDLRMWYDWKRKRSQFQYRTT